jgi:competence protein ComEC
VLAILARILNLSAFFFLLHPFAFILFIALALGAARYQKSVPSFDAFHIAFYNDREYDLLITGTLVEPPDYRDTYTNLRVNVQKVDTGDSELPVHGLILVRVTNNQTFEYGDLLRFRGKLKTPPENEDFSYRDYLAAKNIYSYVSNAEVTILPGNSGNPIIAALYKFKQRSLDNIYRMFPDPESSLLAGILLGVDTGLTSELQQAFKNTGTAHIIAISGFNISIIAGIFFAFFSKFLGDRRGAILAILGIALYTFIVGADAAVVRAAVNSSGAGRSRLIHYWLLPHSCAFGIRCMCGMWAFNFRSLLRLVSFSTPRRSLNLRIALSQRFYRLHLPKRQPNFFLNLYSSRWLHN